MPAPAWGWSPKQLGDCTEVAVGRTVHYCQGIILRVHGQEQRRRSTEEQWEGIVGLVYRYGEMHGI